MERMSPKYRIYATIVAWAIRSLAYEIGESYSSEEHKTLLDFHAQLLRGYRIPGRNRAVQDRFAFVISEMRQAPELYSIIKEAIFYDWLDWTKT